MIVGRCERSLDSSEQVLPRVRDGYFRRHAMKNFGNIVQCGTKHFADSLVTQTYPEDALHCTVPVNDGLHNSSFIGNSRSRRQKDLVILGNIIERDLVIANDIRRCIELAQYVYKVVRE